MKRLFLIILATGLIVSNLYANPVDFKKASQVAKGFVGVTFAESAKGEALELVQATSAYYVFNIGQSGFVIISADDCFRPIIGYSEEGTFPVVNPSPEMVYYLDNLSQGREGALRASIQRDAIVANEWQCLFGGNPLPSRNGQRKSFHLVQTRWNQNFPYNKFCPSEGGRTYAGCVATAMSQVMNYWRYPTRGYGKHSYTYGQYGEISANFAEAEYDFDLMPVSISDMSPVENVDAIALFMYHCGVAVDMMYGTDGSGAYSEDVPEAVLKYFGYTNCCRMVYRDSYPLEEFQAMLKNQFDLGWPVYYSGTDTDGQGGHAFVCDGYDENDLFHFNWGWSGSGDGFYAIDALDVSGYAFNSGQAFTANFVPASVFANTSKAPDYFIAIPNDDDDFTVTLSWTCPTAFLDGTPLQGIEAIVVMRDGAVVQTFENPAPGESMTFVDEAGIPVTVNYSIYALCNGIGGRQAHANGINLGPACLWTVNLKADQETGWGDGILAFLNSSGVTVAELTALSKSDSVEVEVPMGRAYLKWTAPTDSLQIGMEILDATGQRVFEYEGPSTLMPQGCFFETVNTCGAEGYCEAPSNLTATVVDEDVVLQWEGVAQPGYGYIIYRDEFFYTMVGEGTAFTDQGAALNMHSYSVTSFTELGESDPSNTVSAVVESELAAPKDLAFEVLANNKIKVTWVAPETSDQFQGYYVFRKAKDGEFKRVKTVGPSATSYTDSFNVPDGNHYYYKVVAVYNRAYAESSPARSLQHPDQHYVEVNRSHIPSGLTLEEQEGELLLQWEVAMLAETYHVYRNGERIAEGLAEPQYTCTADGEPAYFQVTGVLNGVESSRSYKACYAHYDVVENESAPVKLYPNPSSGLASVCAEGLREVKVYNATGQHLFDCQASGDEVSIDMKDYKPGVYFLRIGTNRGEQVQKLILMQNL